jgi:hypothetical protein
MNGTGQLTLAGRLVGIRFQLKSADTTVDNDRDDCTEFAGGAGCKGR